jgi:hypothetical protein
MLVYSVVSGVDYEGYDLRGVFASREDALRFVESCRVEGEFRYVDSVGVVESELGSGLDMFESVEWLDASVYGGRE